MFNIWRKKLYSYCIFFEREFGDSMFNHSKCNEHLICELKLRISNGLKIRIINKLIFRINNELLLRTNNELILRINNELI